MKIKIASLAVALLLVSVSALAAVEKDEIVYARLSETGAPAESYVVNAFSADEAGAYEDYGDYASALSLTPGLSAVRADGSVSLSLPAGRSYYQGTLENLALPWTISISYALDGAAVDASALAGASGRLRIEIKVARNTAAQDGWYEAYTLQATATLDAALCENISAEGATVAVAGSGYAVSWIVLPGNETSLALEADVRGFRMDPIQFAGVRLNVQIDDSAFSGALDSLAQSAETLTTGAASLSTGASDAADGAAALSESASTLADAMAAFGEQLSGSDALAAEFQALLTGYQGIAAGIENLSAGLSGLSTASAQLSEGVSLFAAGLGNADIGAMVKGAFGGDFAPRSYLSGRNANTRSVQFVLMTPGID